MKLYQYYQVNQARIHRLSKEGGWIVTGQIASVIGALTLVRVLTEYLTPGQYGQLALGLTVATLVNQVVMGGITAGTSRYYPIAAENQDLSGYIRATRNLLIYATGAVFVIGFILAVNLKWLGYSQWIDLITAALLFAVLNGYNGVLTGIQNAARQRAIVALHGGIDAWLKILLAVAAVIWLGISSTAVVIGYAFSSFIITISQLIFLRRTVLHEHKPRQIQQQWIHQIWAYSLPFSIFGAFTWMHQISDRWALQYFATPNDVGQYIVLYQLGYTPIALITGLAVSFFGPILYQRSGDGIDHDRIANVHRISWRITRLSLFGTLLGFAISFALHEWLFGLLVASEYRTSSYLLPWVVLAGGIFAAGQMLALKLMSELKPASMTAAKIVTALIGVLLNVIGAAFFGVQGVIAAIVMFSSMYFIWMAVLASRLPMRATF